MTELGLRSHKSIVDGPPPIQSKIADLRFALSVSACALRLWVRAHAGAAHVAAPAPGPGAKSPEFDPKPGAGEPAPGAWHFRQADALSDDAVLYIALENLGQCLHARFVRA